MNFRVGRHETDITGLKWVISCVTFSFISDKCCNCIKNQLGENPGSNIDTRYISVDLNVSLCFPVINSVCLVFDFFGLSL